MVWAFLLGGGAPTQNYRTRKEYCNVFLRPLQTPPRTPDFNVGNVCRWMATETQNQNFGKPNILQTQFPNIEIGGRGAEFWRGLKKMLQYSFRLQSGILPVG